MLCLLKFVAAQEKAKKKQNPLCINYNNPTSRERKKIHAEIKAERPKVIMCQKMKKQLLYPLNWARYVKRTVVLL